MIGRRGFLAAAATTVGACLVGRAEAKPPRLSAPSEVQVVGADGSLVVSWGAVKRAQSYEVEWVRRA